MRICIGRLRLVAYVAPKQQVVTDAECLAGLGLNDANWSALNGALYHEWQSCETCGLPVPDGRSTFCIRHDESAVGLVR